MNDDVAGNLQESEVGISIRNSDLHRSFLATCIKCKLFIGISAPVLDSVVIISSSWEGLNALCSQCFVTMYTSHVEYECRKQSTCEIARFHP